MQITWNRGGKIITRLKFLSRIPDDEATTQTQEAGLLPYHFLSLSKRRGSKLARDFLKEGGILVKSLIFNYNSHTHNVQS